MISQDFFLHLDWPGALVLVAIVWGSAYVLGIFIKGLVGGYDEKIIERLVEPKRGTKDVNNG